MKIGGKFFIVEVPQDRMSALHDGGDVEVPPELRKLGPRLQIRIGGDEVVLNFGGGKVDPIPDGLDPARWEGDLSDVVYHREMRSGGTGQVLRISANYVNPQLNTNPSSGWTFSGPLRRTYEGLP